MKYINLLFFLLLSVCLNAQPDLPITFEDTNLNYDLVGFGNSAASVVTDPTDGANMVGALVKSDSAELWAGVTIGDNGLVNTIPLMRGATKMTVRVWSPDANIPVRLKVEDASDPAISVETEAMTTMAGMWEILEFDFSNEVMGTAAINFANTYNKVSIFFNFGTMGADAGEKTYYWDDMEFVPPVQRPDLPITFEDTDLDYDLIGFGNSAASVITDPTDGNNLVGALIKSDSAELWAGVTIGDNGLASVIPLMGGATKMTVRVWSPDANIPVRLKVEDATNPAISVETETMTTMAGMWETLEFDFSNEVMGTAAINFANTYDKISIFFNFGTTGADAGEKTYYWDDMEFVPPVQRPDLPITFEDTNLDYDLIGFGNAAAAVITDPTDGNNLVGALIKSDSAELWAGVTIGDNGLASVIPLMAGATKMTVRVWSPDANIPVRLKVEDATNPAISVETEAMTTMAGMWETLEFDFTNEVMGTAAINFANTYDKISIFFNFGTTGADAGEKTYYWDDMEFVNIPPVPKPGLPITFEDANLDYNLVGFGNATAAVITDPIDMNNLVGELIKSDTAELWAGATMGGDGLASAIPFAANATQMSVRVWSPDANIPVRLKVEAANDPTISVETEAMTTMAGAWELLVFDFNNEVMGTAALNLANTYDKVSIFFNFGTTGADAGEKTYYWDNVFFVSVAPEPKPDLPITFEDTNLDYNLAGFGNAAAAIITDPTDGNNLVGELIKSDTAELWAGATMGGDGLASAIPFTANSTKISVRVWSPDANIPVRLKVEAANDPTISVETEAMTTMAGMWETLEFDFSNEAMGTAAINFASTYDKISIFFNFGTTGADAGEKTYYWDDVNFMTVTPGPKPELPIDFESLTIDYGLADFGGNVSSIVEDPTNSMNIVGQAIKGDMSETWAGTTIGGDGLASAIPFTATETKMIVRVWSPDANIPIRLKTEDASDDTKSVETEALTTKAGEWEILEFDFSNEAMGTAALNLATTYDKISIFFNFGTSSADAGDKTYFWDDMEFGGIVSTETLDAAANGFKVFPNPANEYLTIELPDFVGLNNSVDISLLDFTGKEISRQITTDKLTTLQISEMSPGAYVLRMETDNTVYTQKIMIVR